MKKNMQCTINAVGRVVIPSEIRNQLKLNTGTSVEIYAGDNAIMIRQYQCGCTICGTAGTIRQFRNRPVCEDCLNAARSMAPIQAVTNCTAQAI